jgi:hypothetical protein
MIAMLVWLVSASTILSAANSPAAEIESGDAQWRLESKSLRVTVDVRAGTISVLDKRIDYTWRQVAESVPSETIAVPRASTPPTVDGDLRDWPRQPLVHLTTDMTADADQVDGPDDVSGEVWVSWSPDRLFLAARVRDEHPLFATAADQQWWEKDSIEFWVNAAQFGLALDPAAPKLVPTRQPAASENAYELVVRATRGQYTVEAAFPWDAVGLPRADVAEGKAFRFALGVNDADQSGAREGQLYFPTTWVHSSPATFAQAVFGDEKGEVAAAPEPATALRNVRQIEDGITYETTSPAGGAEVDCNVTLRLAGGSPDLIVETDIADRTAGVRPFGPIRPFGIDSEQAFVPAARYCDGLLMDCDDMRWRGNRLSTYAGVDMPWVGLTDLDKGYLLLAETPDDGVVLMDAVETAGKTRLAPVMLWENSKGQFRYPRRMMVSFVDHGGYVAICKRYRAYAEQNGSVVTLREEMERLPDVELLGGAPDIWGAWGLEFCREAKAAGMDRMIVNWRGPAKDMEAIKDLGYLISEYDNYVDIQDGPLSESNRAPLPDSAILQGDGNRAQGWVTWDKKTTFMKLCPALAVEAARLEIVPLLEQHPFNARFLDVTTASGLRECYDENHPLTRAEYRAANEALAKCVTELGLVLGGEHGRWYGVPYYHYWEGMQSGGFYSWPAGHVGIELPESREKIGADYLKYGIGHYYRVPLWELCFHDCVVSTWYWGDSTGHLYQVAPEIADKKDAFNVLYGTVPLYWVNRPYSFNWREPALRERLLQSYRNTCKLHEKLLFTRLESHDFLTDDHTVQRTVFSSGPGQGKPLSYECTVNFGEEPYELTVGDQTFVLPQDGFYVKGTDFTQYRALEEGRTVTFIHAPDSYCFCDPGGKRHDFAVAETSAPLTLRVTGPDLLTVGIGGGAEDKDVLIRPEQMGISASGGRARLYALDRDGKRTEQIDFEAGDKGIICRATPDSYLLMTGKAAQKPDLAIDPAAVGVQIDEQRESAVARAEVANAGLTAVRTVVTASVDTSEGPVELGRKAAELKAGTSRQVEIPFDTSRLDGRWLVTLDAQPEAAEEELLANNNSATVPVEFPADHSRWQHRANASVTVDAVDRQNETAVAEVNLGELFGVPADRLELASLRVVELNAAGRPQDPVPAQLDAAEGGTGELAVVLTGDTPAGATRQFAVLCQEKGETAPYAPTGELKWDAEAASVTTPVYRVVFKDGVIAACHSLVGDRPDESFLKSLGVSSQETGWVDEQGELRSFEVLHRGPARIVVRATKDLSGDYHYTKTYAFYRDYFTVSSETNKPIALHSRAYYLLPGQFEDDKGNQAPVDGKGDAEDVSGKNADPKWYAVYADGWAHSCVALTPFSNFTYWDAGSWGGIGFGTGRTQDVRLAYVVHPGEQDATFAIHDCDRLTNPPRVTVEPGQ